MEHAESLLSVIERNKTRNYRTIESIFAVGSPQHTRSSLSHDTIFYLVNFSDHRGFALLGADDRLLPVYAISDDGHLEMSDTIVNKGLASVLGLAISEAEDLLSVDNRVGGVWGGSRDSIAVIDTVPISIGGMTTVGPFMSKAGRNWRQNFPFNRDIPKISGSYPVAGCTAISAVQALSILKAHYDQSLYPNYSIDWNVANNFEAYLGMQPGATVNPDGGLTRLIEVLGRPENLNMEYGVNSSTPRGYNREYMQRTMNNFGFLVKWEFEGSEKTRTWKNSRVAESLTKGYPVIVESTILKYKNESDRDTTNITSTLHSWLIYDIQFRTV